jgi:hypothetical protein
LPQKLRHRSLKSAISNCAASVSISPCTGCAKTARCLLRPRGRMARSRLYGLLGVNFCFWQILLQKSAAADGPLAMSLKAAGFDLPALTLSAQLQRYAMH